MKTQGSKFEIPRSLQGRLRSHKLLLSTMILTLFMSIAVFSTVDNKSSALLSSGSMMLLPCTNGSMGGTVFDDVDADGINQSHAGLANICLLYTSPSPRD